MLKGNCQITPPKKIINPKHNEKMRLGEMGLNFFGGIGIYHMMAHMTRNSIRFKRFHTQLIRCSANILRYLREL